MEADTAPAPIYLEEPNTKHRLYQHLIAMHGQVWPETAKGWTFDEVLASHRVGHRPFGPMTVAHTHGEDAL